MIVEKIYRLIPVVIGLIALILITAIMENIFEINTVTIAFH